MRTAGDDQLAPIGPVARDAVRGRDLADLADRRAHSRHRGPGRFVAIFPGDRTGAGRKFAGAPRAVAAARAETGDFALDDGNAQGWIALLQVPGGPESGDAGG